jgi:hypothetical protein
VALPSRKPRREARHALGDDLADGGILGICMLHFCLLGEMEAGFVSARYDRDVKEKDSPVKFSVIVEDLYDAICQG